MEILEISSYWSKVKVTQHIFGRNMRILRFGFPKPNTELRCQFSPDCTILISCSELLCCCYFVAKGRNVHMIHGRTSSGPPNCITGRIATPLLERGITSSKMHAHTRLQLVSPRVAAQACQSVSLQTLSLVGHQTLSVSQCVSLIKIGLYAESHTSAFRSGDGL